MSDRVNTGTCFSYLHSCSITGCVYTRVVLVSLPVAKLVTIHRGCGLSQSGLTGGIHTCSESRLNPD